MISAGELAAMRAAVATTLPDQCAIQRLVRVEDDAGGWTDTFATASTVACRVAGRDLQPAERELAARLGNRTAFTVTLPPDADLRESDRIGWSGQVFEVLGVLAPRTWMTSVRAVVAREG